MSVPLGHVRSEHCRAYVDNRAVRQPLRYSYRCGKAHRTESRFLPPSFVRRLTEDASGETRSIQLGAVENRGCSLLGTCRSRGNPSGVQYAIGAPLHPPTFSNSNKLYLVDCVSRGSGGFGRLSSAATQLQICDFERRYST